MESYTDVVIWYIYSLSCRTLWCKSVTRYVLVVTETSILSSRSIWRKYCQLYNFFVKLISLDIYPIRLVLELIFWMRKDILIIGITVAYEFGEVKWANSNEVAFILHSYFKFLKWFFLAIFCKAVLTHYCKGWDMHTLLIVFTCMWLHKCLVIKE